MGIEPYLIRSGVLLTVCQRLLRRLCECAEPASDDAVQQSLNISGYRQPVGCGECGGTGYRGRLLMTEMLVPDESEVGRAILRRSDTQELHKIAVDAGMTDHWKRAIQLVEAGATSPA